MSKYRKYIYVISFLVMVLFCWEIIVAIFSIPEYILPSPIQILKEFLHDFTNLQSHIYITVVESLIGFLLGSLFGFILSILFVYSKTLEMSLYPYAIALKSVPVIAIAPLLIIWFGNGIMPKVIVAAIISFFPVVVNMVKGLKSIDNEALDIFNSLSASKRQIFFKLRLPNSLPFLFAALKMSSTLAVIGAIVGEFAGSDEGLGFYIMVSSHRLETSAMFVGIIVSSLLGITFFYLISILERIFIPWEKHLNNSNY